ncbi:hypothetical protein Lser_V15G13431 [Lactuca serriola]
MRNASCILVGCIDQASVGVVEKWGRFEKLADPGLNFFNPCVGQYLAGVLSTRINSLEVKIETKTKSPLLLASQFGKHRVLNTPYANRGLLDLVLV